MSVEKKHGITRMFQSVAQEMLDKEVVTFTASAFHHRGVGKSTVSHRIENIYKLQPHWERRNATMFRRLYRVQDLIEAMKREGDWV
jgi:hypothetical protein